MRARELLAESGVRDPENSLVSNLALEKEVNTFFRLHSPTLIKTLRDVYTDLPDNPDAKTIFLKLRELRNDW